MVPVDVIGLVSPAMPSPKYQAASAVVRGSGCAAAENAASVNRLPVTSDLTHVFIIKFSF